MKKSDLTLLAVALLALNGCRDSDVLHRITQIQELKAKALAEVSHTPYQTKQHEAFAAYYSAIMAEGVAILEEANWRLSLLNAWVNEGELPEMCRDLFVDRDTYRTLIRNCTRNRFFLCADEVQTYDEALKAVLAKLTPENRRKLEATPECARSLER